MFSFTGEQLNAWIALYTYPTVRILALFAAAPIWNNVGMPRRVRLIAGLAIAACIAPALPPAAATAPPPGSELVVAVLLREMLIGAAMGFSIRLMFAAIDLAGDLIGLQMGLSFAVFFDPQAAGQTTVLSQFLGLFAALIFLGLDGHLLTVEALVRSFDWLPAGGPPVAAAGFRHIVASAAYVFSAGVMMALPAIAALLITNAALGVLTRAAPQLNLFSLGFPITLAVGTIALITTLPLFGDAFQRLYARGFDTIGLFLRAASAT